MLAVAVFNFKKLMSQLQGLLHFLFCFIFRDPVGADNRAIKQEIKNIGFFRGDYKNLS